MMIRFLMFFSVFVSVSLSGGLESHFKPVSNKSGNHSMRNIDFIYTINLDQRPQKFEYCVNQLSAYGIYPCRFSAVNGWELSLEEIDTLGVQYAAWMKKGLWGTTYPVNGGGEPNHEIISVVGKRYFSHCLSRGAIGIVLSHLSILQDAYDSGYETIWVMEDDIQLIKDPHLLSDLIDRLDKLVDRNWDILFTDQDTKNNNGTYVPCRGYAQKPNFNPKNPERFSNNPITVSSDFRKINARYGAYSMIVRRSGMKKILDFIKTYKIFLPYDMEFYLPNNINLYAVIDDVVSTKINALSDNGGPNYLND